MAPSHAKIKSCYQYPARGHLLGNVAGNCFNMAGNITIIEAKDNYVKVSKDIIFNEKIDHVTLAVYVRLMVLGKRWNLNIAGAASVLRISKDRVRTIFARLEEAGYLRRKRSHDASGRFSGWDYEISNVPFTDIPKTPSSEEYRHRENTDVGEMPTSANPGGIIEDYKPINKDSNPINRDYKDSAPFDFRRAVIDLGVSATLVDDWMKVRKAKRSADTLTAFQGLVREIQKSGRSAEDCIRFSCERSWCGFEAAWMEREDRERQQRTAQPAAKQETHMDYYTRVMRELHPERYATVDNQ